MEPLYIFMDLEAAHGNNYFGDIIELAAQVDPRILEKQTFSSLINTKQNLSYFSLRISKITREMLNGKKYFPEVFNEFMEWVLSMVARANKKKETLHYPVLVAHGGFSSDFMMLQSNMERNEMKLDLLNENNLFFGDTYLLAKKLKECCEKELEDCQLSIEKLFRKFFPDTPRCGMHRALPDVQCMVKIFLESPLVKFFHQIPIASFEERTSEYNTNSTSKTEKTKLEENLPKGMAKITYCMTLNRLLRNGLTYSRLESLFESSESTLDFFDKLKDIGIERKAAKSIAQHLASSGLICSGKIEQDDWGDVKGIIEHINEPDEASRTKRLDSGYFSIDDVLTEKDWGRFYEMFVDEFFYPPEVYEYTFGSFSVEEIEKIDIIIDEMFEAHFGEVEDSPINEQTVHKKNNVSIKEDCLSVMENETNKLSPDEAIGIEESWDDEFCDDDFTMPAPIKVVPIGMTMDNFNGQKFEERIPLLRYFEEFNMKCVPDGGMCIPKKSTVTSEKE